MTTSTALDAPALWRLGIVPTVLLALTSPAWGQVNVPPTEPILAPPPVAAAASPATGTGAPLTPLAGTPAPEPVVAQPPAGAYASTVAGRKPSPVWTQDRNFTTTRFWVLDPGTYALETWAWARVYPEKNGSQDPSSIRFFQEVSWGIAPHLQLDLYGEFRLDAQTNVTTGQDQASRLLSYKGYRAELRIALPEYYGQVPLNPVIYLEWMSFSDGDPNRAEARILLGGMATERLFLAANPYFETNVTPTNKTFGKDAAGQDIVKPVYLMDAEAGTTLAAGYRVNDWFNLSLQAKVGFDMLGDANNRWHFVAWAGPGFIVKPLPGKAQRFLKIIGSAMFLVPGSDTEGGEGKGYDLPQRFEPTLIVSTQLP